jgi:pimeloyl-ACP methyl ester carboxylesterase
MSSITPFKIAIPSLKLDRLQQKLVLSNHPAEISNASNPWSRGVPLSDIKRLAEYWGNGFRWRKAEAKLNELPQHLAKTEVDDFGTCDIHFIHQRSEIRNAIPLLFLHGWPGNFMEVTRILPELTRRGKDGPTFHVVAPSLIDFGFSSASKKVCTLGSTCCRVN